MIREKINDKRIIIENNIHKERNWNDRNDSATLSQFEGSWKVFVLERYKDGVREVVVDLDYGVISAGSRGHSTLLK